MGYLSHPIPPYLLLFQLFTTRATVALGPGCPGSHNITPFPCAFGLPSGKVSPFLPPPHVGSLNSAHKSVNHLFMNLPLPEPLADAIGLPCLVNDSHGNDVATIPNSKRHSRSPPRAPS